MPETYFVPVLLYTRCVGYGRIHTYDQYHVFLYRNTICLNQELEPDGNVRMDMALLKMISPAFVVLP